MRRGFTLVELLVVIAIVAVLAALLFPVFARAKAAAKGVQNLANLRSVAQGIALYTQGSDGAYPFAYSYETDTFWRGAVRPYVGSDAVQHSPFREGTAPSYSANTQILVLFDRAQRFRNFFEVVGRESELPMTGSLVLLGEGNERWDGPPRTPDIFAYPHPALARDHSGDPSWCVEWVVPGTDRCNNKQIAWREGRAGFAYADTHARTIARGALRDADWDVRCVPGVGCEGHATPPRPD